jgi:hypothetical protein
MKKSEQERKSNEDSESLMNKTFIGSEATLSQQSLSFEGVKWDQVNILSQVKTAFSLPPHKKSNSKKKQEFKICDQQLESLLNDLSFSGQSGRDSKVDWKTDSLQFQIPLIDLKYQFNSFKQPAMKRNEEIFCSTSGGFRSKGHVSGFIGSEGVRKCDDLSLRKNVSQLIQFKFSKEIKKSKNVKNGLADTNVWNIPKNPTPSKSVWWEENEVMFFYF